MLGKPEEIQAWLVPDRLLQEGVNRANFTLSSGEGTTVVFVDLSVK